MHAAVKCTGALPAAATNADAWPGTCSGLAAGSVCTATCSSGSAKDATAGAPTLTCGDNGSWSASGGACNKSEAPAHSTARLPSQQRP